MKNFGRVLQFLAHFQPVTEVISHVVAAEGNHGHGVAARDADGAGSGRSGLGGHGGADEHAMLPVARLIDQGGQTFAATAENDGGDGHALGIFPVR